MNSGYYMTVLLIIVVLFCFCSCSEISDNSDRQSTTVDNTYFPVYAPSPQLPANNCIVNDFYAEEITPLMLYAKYEELINTESITTNAFNHDYKYITKNNYGDRDATNTYDLICYTLTRRNRFGWLHNKALYSWKEINGSSIIYTYSRSPIIGDSDSSGSLIVDNYSFDVLSLSNGKSYTYQEGLNIKPDVIWTHSSIFEAESKPYSLETYSIDNYSLGYASPYDSTHISYNNKIYERNEGYDYHTDNKHTIVLWANAHGPQSDPAEPAIVLFRLAKDLCSDLEGFPFLQYLRDFCKIVIIPCANPYGLANKMRNNGNGVNINRNYNCPGWSNQIDNDKGCYPGDQPETQFIMNVCLDTNPDIVFDIHCLSYLTEANMGRCVIYAPPPLDERSVNIMNRYGLKAETRSQSSGNNARAADWISQNGMRGGTLEMNAGEYASCFNGNQHTSLILEADYTLLLNSILNAIDSGGK